MQFSKVTGEPNASMAESTPSPFVNCMIRSTASPSVGSTTTSAPIFFASSLRSGLASTAMTSPAPSSRAPAVAHKPTGPCAKTATVPPAGISAFSAPTSPVDSMSVVYSACSSLRSSGIATTL